MGHPKIALDGAFFHSNSLQKIPKIPTTKIYGFNP
jgi:hypothetical protein